MKNHNLGSGSDGRLENDAVLILSVEHLNAGKRNNVLVVNKSTVVVASGNVIILFDILSRKKKYAQGKDGGGIGAIALHPALPLLVVAEQCKARPPNVYVYKILDNLGLDLQQVLENGTERGYSAAAFNHEGSLLATVGSAPDYMLTLWNWEESRVILRNKAFSQEIYNVGFSPFFDGRLVTSGMGHIRMWKMARTFTGLKLVGELGKFGQVELSDICAYLEFPDGKILSGTETGQLLLWDGNLIKAVLGRRGCDVCHEGNIEALKLDKTGSLVISAGQDGYMRTWDASTVCSLPFYNFNLLRTYDLYLKLTGSFVLDHHPLATLLQQTTYLAKFPFYNGFL